MEEFKEIMENCINEQKENEYKFKNNLGNLDNKCYLKLIEFVSNKLK